jgi:hypothetical protein
LDELFSDVNIGQAMVGDALAALTDPEPLSEVLALQEISPGGAVHPVLLKGDRHSSDGCG